jgi:hypothetical protein
MRASGGGALLENWIDEPGVELGFYSRLRCRQSESLEPLALGDDAASKLGDPIGSLT